MNPDTKLIIDQLSKRFSDMVLKLDKRFVGQESQFIQKL